MVSGRGRDNLSRIYSKYKEDGEFRRLRDEACAPSPLMFGCSQPVRHHKLSLNYSIKRPEGEYCQEFLLLRSEVDRDRIHSSLYIPYTVVLTCVLTLLLLFISPPFCNVLQSFCRVFAMFCPLLMGVLLILQVLQLGFSFFSINISIIMEQEYQTTIVCQVKNEKNNGTSQNRFCRRCPYYYILVHLVSSVYA